MRHYYFTVEKFNLGGFFFLFRRRLMASKIADQVRGRLIFFQCNQKLSFKDNTGKVDIEDISSSE